MFSSVYHKSPVTGTTQMNGMLSPKIFILAVILFVFPKGADADQKCWTNFGFCQNVNNSCSGNYVRFLCNGPNARRCCIPAFNDEKCHAQGGKCQSTSMDCAGGNYFTGLCGGPLNRRCCISNVTDNAYNDERCETRGGKCRYTIITCVDGNYVNGLCGGPSNRRCCIPNEPALKCDANSQRLACQIFQSPNVLLTDSRTSNAVDKPFNNIKDMCDGRPAVRSSNQCDGACQDSGQLVCIHDKVLQYLVDLKDAGRMVVEELSGTCHKGRLACSHYEGTAVALLRDGERANTSRNVATCKVPSA